MAMVVAVGAPKGGVGKTTVSVSLGAASVWNKVPALIVDLDGQASATTWAVGREAMQAVPLEETLYGWAAAGWVLHGTSRIPAGGELRCATLPFEGVPGLLVAASNRQFRVSDLEQLALDRFDGLVVLDCPPDLDIAALRSVAPLIDAVVVPIEPEAASLPAVPEMLGWAFDVGRADLAESTLVVLNKTQRTAVHQLCESVLRQQHGKKVWRRTIPKATAVPEAELRREVVGRTSPVGKLVAELLRDVVSRARMRRAA